MTYVAWALEVPGVTRAWVKPEWLGIGTIGLTFVCDDQVGGIIPNPDKVAEVQAYIDARRPVEAETIVFGPTPKPMNPVIPGLNPATDTVKAAVVAELADLLRNEATPGATILVSHISEAISQANGEVDHTLTTPAVNFTCLPHEIATLGVPAWS